MVTAALLFGATGCVESPRLVSGSRAVVAVVDPFTSLNPWTVAASESSTDAQIAWLTGTGFGYRGSDGAFVRDPSFGRAEIVARDPLTVRYTISDSARWSDGTPVGSADLLLSWAARSGVLDADFATVPDPGLALVTQVPQLAADGRTIFLHFDEFWGDWETAIAPTLPAHVVASRALDVPASDEKERAAAAKDLATAILDGDADAISSIATVWIGDFDYSGTALDDDLLVAAGPYRVRLVKPDAVTLVANNEYSGDRAPHVQELVVRTASDAVAAVGLLATTADVASVDADADALAAVPRIGPKFTSTVTSGPRLEQLQLKLTDSRSGAFDDLRIREAFLHVVPRDELIEELVAPVVPDAVPLNSFLVPPTSADYAATVEANGSSRYTDVDVETAKDLLADAGLPAPTVCVLYDPADRWRARAFELIRNSAARAGFQVTDCSTPDWRRALGRAAAYDAVLLSWDPTRFGPAFAGAVLRSDSETANLNGFSDPAVDALVDELTQTDDPDRRAELLTQLDEAIWDVAAGIPLTAHPVLTVIGPVVEGVSHSAFGGSVFWDAWEWTAPPVTPR